MKSTVTYWNPLASENAHQWETIEGSDGNLSQPTFSRLMWKKNNFIALRIQGTDI